MILVTEGAATVVEQLARRVVEGAVECGISVKAAKGIDGVVELRTMPRHSTGGGPLSAKQRTATLNRA